ncbi:MAG: phage holin family protein [Cyclobacteriaceae bacterium]|nr:phage holin family protein [Cyclobacteriaceae bacterium]
MKNFIIRLLLSAIAVFICATVLPGAHVDSFLIAIVVAGVLAVLNVLIKPLLVILTIPITIVTLGLFLLVINTILVMSANWLVPGFSLDGFWWALIFSVLLSIINSVFGGLNKSR